MNDDKSVAVYFWFVAQTISQLSANHYRILVPSKWLVPTPPKSYQMFFQDVTHSIVTSDKLLVGMRRASSALTFNQRTLTSMP
jgi:hypothetical protein